ncbi:TIGR03364 family FAD-dependent oxidoreductase [Wohlfahrtiimonas larvae]
MWIAIMKYDIAIVGAGIIGLSHAYAAAKRGLKVLVCERTDQPLGASIRNFGFGVVTGQREGEMLNLANQSRNIWSEWINHADIDAKRNGSLLIARNQVEAAVLESFVENKVKQHGYECELLSKQDIGALYGGQFSRYSTILHGKNDQVIFSREALPQLIRYLSSLPNVTMKFGTLVKDLDVDQGRLITTIGDFSAAHIFVCSGHDYQTLLADEIQQLNPMICRLQMLRVRPVKELSLQHALFTGLSCTHYDAFRDLPETAILRLAMEKNHPEFVKYGIHLLITPTPSGDLIIGDSHAYSQFPRPFSSENIDNILLKLAEETLGLELKTIERWTGKYGSKGSEPYSIIKAGSCVTAVLMRTGLGMSIGPALGENIVANVCE